MSTHLHSFQGNGEKPSLNFTTLPFATDMTNPSATYLPNPSDYQFLAVIGKFILCVTMWNEIRDYCKTLYFRSPKGLRIWHLTSKISIHYILRVLWKFMHNVWVLKFSHLYCSYIFVTAFAKIVKKYLDALSLCFVYHYQYHCKLNFACLEFGTSNSILWPNRCQVSDTCSRWPLHFEIASHSWSSWQNSSNRTCSFDRPWWQWHHQSLN
jgi:hypothetical protein